MGWYSTAWKRRFKITIDHTKVDSNLTDFPVLLTEDNMPADLWTDALADGADIVLTEDDGVTKLKRELVRFTPGTPDMELWVKVPSLLAAVDTDIYLYFLNVAGVETNDKDTWDANFLLVTHLDTDPAVSFGIDSSQGGNDATVKVSTPTRKDCLWGRGSHFNGDQGYIFGTLNDQCTDFTVEAWFNDLSTTRTFERIADKKYGGGFHLSRNSNAANTWGGGVQELVSPWGRYVTLADTVWHQIVTRRQGTTHTIIGDGGAVTASGVVPGNPLSNDTFAVACYYDDSNPSQRGEDMDICEVRFSDMARSDEWIAATYNSLNSPSTFYSIGSVEGEWSAEAGRYTSFMPDGYTVELKDEYTATLPDEHTAELKDEYTATLPDEYTAELRK